ncbi:MAG TPA: YdcF family protein, partial [Bdellovibrionota bacterium]|nr:YdcF family protein [Bdellovibrionota bacterium]
MALFLILLPLAVSLVALRLKRRRAARVSAGVSVGLLALMGCGFLPTALLHGLEVHPALVAPRWGARNAIVVLGAGDVQWPDGLVSTAIFGQPRVREAARLYVACKAAKRICRVIPSGGDPTVKGHPEAEIMREELTALGIPDGDIEPEPRSANTFRNADYSQVLLQKFGPDATVLVTSGFHLRRALLYFAHFGVDPQPAPADRLEAGPTWIPEALNLVLTDLALHEYVGLWRYHLYNALGWNAPSRRGPSV